MIALLNSSVLAIENTAGKSARVYYNAPKQLYSVCSLQEADVLADVHFVVLDIWGIVIMS